MEQTFNIKNIRYIYSWSTEKKEGYLKSYAIRRFSENLSTTCNICYKKLSEHGAILSHNKIICPKDYLVECCNDDFFTITEKDFVIIKDAIDNNTMSTYNFTTQGKKLENAVIVLKPTYIKIVLNAQNR